MVDRDIEYPGPPAFEVHGDVRFAPAEVEDWPVELSTRRHFGSRRSRKKIPTSSAVADCGSLNVNRVPYPTTGPLSLER